MRTSMKKISTAVLAASVLTTGFGFLESTPAFAAAVQQSVKQTPVSLSWNGKKLQGQGLLINGTTYIPVTALRDGLGWRLTYNAAEKSYNLDAGNQQLSLDYGGLFINQFYLKEYESKNVNGRLYVPFGALRDYLGVQGSWNAAQKSLAMSPSVQNDIQIKPAQIKQNAKNGTIELNYPQVSGLTSPEAEKKINDALKKHAENVAADARKQLAEAGAPRDGMTYDFESMYLVTYNKNGVLSLLMEDYGFTGGAHGMTYRQGYTFNLKDGSQMKLTDVIGSSPATMALLNKEITLQFKKGEYADLNFGEFTKLDADPDFYVNNNGIVLFFQLYEYTPYAAGFPEFPFQFSSVLPKGTKPFPGLQ
ncbi:DUF4163 domain-containing protein [Paenibacillus sp. JX-17]|uniref:DUF4163 domain-containing protein n=1 Tax=Paenibacillus lacisoli TaxID=3064525 RepID=A0ABT9CGX0_9BACL|nr:DUF4163 domain-containing protein [Paenibacillus sp. JX-17]MDO7908519.1 DUF4163 domain-containing protein [Paenibacillus sp. JX-17]